MKNFVNIRKSETAGSSSALLHRTTQVFITVLILTSLMADVIDVLETIFIHCRGGDYHETMTLRNMGSRASCTVSLNFLQWTKQLKKKIWILTPVGALGQCNGETIAKENSETFHMASKEIKTFSAQSSVDENETASEWIINSITSGGALTIEFNEFQLGGPECGEDVTGMSLVTIMVSTANGTRPYTFCKGRERKISFSSINTLSILYCNKYKDGKFSFTVKAACSGKFLAESEKKIIRVNRKRSICFVSLQSLEYGSHIHVQLEKINMKRSKKCTNAFFSVKEFDSDIPNVFAGKSLLPKDEGRMCNSTAAKQMNFSFESSLSLLNISYKNTGFTLTFWKQSKKEDATIKSRGASTQARASPDIEEDLTTQRIAGISIEDNSDDGNTVSLGKIVALACGLAFVILALIVTVWVVKRRSSKKARASSSSSNSNKSDNVGVCQSDLHTPVVRTGSIGSINNMTYDRVVKGTVGERACDKTRGPNKGEWTLSTIKLENQSNIQRESTHRRLEGLEAKYGVFPAEAEENNTLLNHGLSTLHPPENTIAKNHTSCSQKKSSTIAASTSRTTVQNSYELFRKGTRPPLPPPRYSVENRGNIQVATPSNMYETIDDITNGEETHPPRQVSYDIVTPDEYSSTNEFQKLSQKVMYSRTPSMYDEAGIDFRINDVQYNSRGDIVNKFNNAYAISEASSVRSSAENLCETTEDELQKNSENTCQFELLNNDSKCSLSSDHHAAKSTRQHPLLHSKSHHQNSLQHSLQHTTPSYPHRTSLPDMLESHDYISLDSDCSRSVESSIQDADSYLRPRPSFPDASITPAYSSSEDMSEMRRRLLKAAHPSLLDNPRDLAIKMGSNQHHPWYDSPRPSFDDTAFNSQNKITSHYDSPRSSNTSGKI